MVREIPSNIRLHRANSFFDPVHQYLSKYASAMQDSLLQADNEQLSTYIDYCYNPPFYIVRRLNTLNQTETVWFNVEAVMKPWVAAQLTEMYRGVEEAVTREVQKYNSTFTSKLTYRVSSSDFRNGRRIMVSVATVLTDVKETVLREEVPVPEVVSINGMYVRLVETMHLLGCEDFYSADADTFMLSKNSRTEREQLRDAQRT